MTQQTYENLRAQCIEMDFGGEVPYSFDYLPENNRLNREMFARAVELAKRKKLPQPSAPGQGPLDHP